MSGSDEIYLYGTNPHMRDSDLDGLSDSEELALGTNPLLRDSDGDGLPDGADPFPLTHCTLDRDDDVLQDEWEAAWLGSTGATDNACGDYNSDGMANIVNLLSATDPAAVPSPGFALINGITAAGYDVWQTTVNEVWAETNSAACITSSVNRVRMTGLGVDTYNGGILTAQSESEDWLGNVTRNSTYTDASSATTWNVTDTPNSNVDAVQKSVAGYPVMNVSAASITNAFTYDGFSRQVLATDGRSSTTVTAYNDLGQVAYTQTTTNRTSYFYNNLGQRTMVSDALGQVSHTAFDPQGKTIAEWGTSYPVAYQFDSAGRMIALATTRSNDYANVNLNTLVPEGETLSSLSAQNSALDITRWFYDQTTGLLTEKVDADGNGSSYTHTDSGKLATRQWARGITTTYHYNILGQLTEVDYSVWSTPDVIYTHDRLGRVISAAISAFDYENNALGQRTRRADYFNASTIDNDFTYNNFGEVIEANMGNNTFINDYDPIGNRLQTTVDSGHSTVTNMYLSNELNQYTAWLD